MKQVLLLLFFCTPFLTFSQFNYGCDGERYVMPVIEDYEVTNVQFGRNVEPDGDSVSLFMDIYSPINDDVDARPAIVLAHGGSFIGGAKGELANTCQRLAEHGYVAATIDYRLLSILQGIPDSIAAMDIAVKAAQDMKAAIRWFKHSAIEDGNPYNIDPDMMFCGGLSAGAITALIVGTLDQDEINQPFLLELLENNSGIAGNTGDMDFLQYGSEVRGILNFSGAVYDLNWIDENDPLIVSYHGDADETVPYTYGFVNVFYNPIVPLHGSGNIHAHLESNDIPNYLYTVEGGGHTDIYFQASYQDQLDEFTANADAFFADIICEGLVNTINSPIANVVVSPNPAKEVIQLTGLVGNAQLIIYDGTGKLMLDTNISQNDEIEISSFSSGVYYYSIIQDNIKQGNKFIKL